MIPLIPCSGKALEEIRDPNGDFKGWAGKGKGLPVGSGNTSSKSPEIKRDLDSSLLAPIQA